MMRALKRWWRRLFGPGRPKPTGEKWTAEKGWHEAPGL